VSLARTLAWNTIVQVAGRMLGLVASFWLTRLMLQHLGLAEFGTFTAATAFVTLFTVLAESGLYLVSVRRASQEPENRAAILGTALGLRLLWSVPPLVAACVLAQIVPTERYPTFDAAFKLAVLTLALNAYLVLLSQFLTGVFRLHLRMDLAVIGEVGSRFVALGAVVLAIRAGGGLQWLIAAVVSATAANLIYAWIVARRFERFTPQLDPTLARELLRESAVLAFVIVFGLLRLRLDTLLLGVMATAVDVGIYGASMKVHEVLVTFPGLFVALLYPVFSRLAAVDAASLQRAFQRTFEALLHSGVALTLAVVAVAPQVTSILTAPQAATPMRILALSMPAKFLVLGISHLLLAEARQRLVLYLYVALTLATLAANVALIPRWSYNGAALAGLITELLGLGALALIWVAGRRMPLDLRGLWGVPLAVVVWAGVHLAVEPRMPRADASVAAQLVAAIVVSGGVVLAYLGLALGLRILPIETVRSVLRRKTAPAAPGPAA
jgi:O-antigen/teichoic acid export membrane protein